MTTVRVCKEWFPKGYYKSQKNDGFPMNDILAEQIEILAKNIKKDWDFTIIVSGGGEVRVGKSVLAMQIAIYWHYLMEKYHGLKLPFTVKDNFVFDGSKLIKQGNYLGITYKHCALIFDEAGSDLDSKKVMKSSTQDVLDYFRECGQYNMLNILVIPEYFDLPRGIAISRSICLLDVDYIIDEEGIFQRGFFNFYSRANKKQLYLKGKKESDYHAYKPDFRSRFANFYPIDKPEYQAAKLEAMKKRENKTRTKFQMQRDASWFVICDQLDITQQELADKMEALTGIFVHRTVVSDAIRHYLSEDERKASENK